MTVSSETYRVQYAGNGVTTAFTVPWRFLANSHVLAIHTDAADADTPWVEGTHYTLTGAGAATGTLTAIATPTNYTPATGTRLTIVVDPPLTQTTDYVSNDDFPAQTHEDDHDKLVMMIHYVQEQLDRTIKLKASTTNLPLVVGDISTAVAALTGLAVATTLSATSTSSNSVGTGAKTFTIQADKYFSGGDFVLVKDSAAPSTNYMFGQVTSYSGTTLILDSQVSVGSGTKTAWTINLAGPRGAPGTLGDATIDAIAALTTAADQVIYSTGVDAFAMTGLTAAGRALIDDTSNTNQRTTLGLGNIATAAIASQAESETGTANDKAMTPLGVAQSIAIRSGLVRLNSGTVAGAATLDIVLTSYTSYRGVHLVLSGFRPATDNTTLAFRVSTNGGSTYDAGASDYGYAHYGTTFADTVITGGAAAATQIELTELSATGMGNGTTDGYNGTIDLFNQTSTAFYPRITYSGTYWRTVGLVGASVAGGGLRRAAQDTDAIRILFSSGNIAEGKWALYGYP